MKLYCASCGLQLRLIRKALPKFGTIIDLVEFHECLKEPVDPTSIIIEAPISTGDQQKFVSSLNELKPSKITPTETFEPRRSSMTGTDDLRDRRFDREQVPSSAPSSVLDHIKSMSNSIPTHDIRDDSTDSEMGG